jgi:cell wall-associated NlpC family hydrolase
MYFRPLSIFQRSVAAAAVAAALAGPVVAAPADDMGQFMAERGWVEQIKQVGSDVRDRASNLVGNAMLFLGVPYKRGGNSAETGFDCSGFVRAVYEQSVGQLLPRKASEQAAATTAIDKSELQPGDLVFFNTLKAAFSHVGIYIGDGKFVHSPRSGAVVRVEDMRISYWQTRFDGARRVDGAGSFTSLKAVATGKPAVASPAAAAPAAALPAAKSAAPVQGFAPAADHTGAY